jgi:hypothetical protein
MGPIGPMELPDEGSATPLGPVLLSLVAVGSAAVGFLYALRRLRRRDAVRTAERSSGGLHADELLRLPVDEFYKALLDIVRARLDHVAGRDPHTLTPAQLGSLDLLSAGSESDAQETWKALCGRAERALYAADAEAPADRARDLELVRKVVSALDRAHDKPGGVHGA